MFYYFKKFNAKNNGITIKQIKLYVLIQQLT